MDINTLLRGKGIKPGQTMGLPNLQGMSKDAGADDLAKWLEKNGLKVRGQQFTSTIGTSQVDIRLSGDAKYLIGFAIVDNYSVDGTAQNPAAVISMLINNSLIIEQAPVQAFNFSVSAYATTPYHQFTRQLNGSDNVVLTITDTAARNYNIYFYYI